LRSVNSGTIMIMVFPATASLPTGRDIISHKHNLPKDQLVDKKENEDNKFWKLPSVTSTFGETKATARQEGKTASSSNTKKTTTKDYHNQSVAHL